MYITVDMIFKKEWVRRFAFSMSVSDSYLEFEDRDKLNSLVRSYLTRQPEGKKPRFRPEVTKVVVKVNGRERNASSLCYLPDVNMRYLEDDFEDLFFSLFHKVESFGGATALKRKEVRIVFLQACGITEDTMTEDAFRKSYDRYLRYQEKKVAEFLEKSPTSLVNVCTTGLNYFVRKRAVPVRKIPVSPHVQHVPAQV